MPKPKKKRLTDPDRCTLELPKAFEKYPDVEPKKSVSREVKSFVGNCMEDLFRKGWR